MYTVDKPHREQASFHHKNTEDVHPIENSNDFFDFLFKKILNLNLNENQLDFFFNWSNDLIQHISGLYKDAITSFSADSYFIKRIDSIDTNISNKIIGMNSSYKRKKYIEKDSLYVKPKTYAIGVRWDGKLKKFVQCSFQYVSIEKTIKSLFTQRQFHELNFSYNSTKQHTEGVYESFECGSLAKEISLFTSEPYTVQLQLYVDDIEICQALQPTAGIHKVKAVYLKIVNLPSKYLSRLENMYIVAVCNANDVKELGFNHILELISKEIETLETDAVELDEDLRLKSILTSFTFDNLGGNECFGLQMNFSQGQFCRICTISKKESEQLTVDDLSLWRTKEEYTSFIVDGVENLRPKSSKGYKGYCKLNNCNHFHTVTNHTVDPLHDILEGVVIILLNSVFKHCVSNKLIGEEELTISRS